MDAVSFFFNFKLPRCVVRQSIFNVFVEKENIRVVSYLRTGIIVIVVNVIN